MIFNFKILIILVVFLAGLAVGFIYSGKIPHQLQVAQTQGDKYQLFLGEIYDKIKDNYWDNLSEPQVLELFKLSAQNSGLPGDLTTETKEKFLNDLTKALKNQEEGKRKEIVANIASQVLSSLNPVGRSGLYTQRQEKELKNTVENINPDKDLYKDLGLEKGADQKQVEEAQKKLVSELVNESSPEAKKKLAEVKYAGEVLSKDDQKKKYDSGGIEPTVFSKLVSPNVAYIYLKKFSPTTFEEFQKAFASFDTPTGPKALIFDLRGNVGGAIDVLPYFLGNFIGKNSYAYDFFHKGQYQPFKTTLDKLPSVSRYNQMVILIDEKTQSSAELLAASLKKYHLGVIVGVPSKGWGTVEKVFPLDHQIDESQKYSIFLVHSITIRDDGLPIEGRGVEPNINIKDGSWEAKLTEFFHYPELTLSTKNILNNKE